jgi:hypothetical protein
MVQNLKRESHYRDPKPVKYSINILLAFIRRKSSLNYIIFNLLKAIDSKNIVDMLDKINLTPKVRRKRPESVVVYI